MNTNTNAPAVLPEQGKRDVPAEHEQHQQPHRASAGIRPRGVKHGADDGQEQKEKGADDQQVNGLGGHAAPELNGEAAIVVDSAVCAQAPAAGDVLSPAAPQDERAAFEAIAQSFQVDLTRNKIFPDAYQYAHTEHMWKFWLSARAALPAQAAAPAEHDCPDCLGSGESTRLVGGGPEAYDEACLCAPCGGTGAAIATVADEPDAAAVLRALVAHDDAWAADSAAHDDQERAEKYHDEFNALIVQARAILAVPVQAVAPTDARGPLVLPEDVPATLVRDLRSAVEGECDGLDVTERQARMILSFLLTQRPELAAPQAGVHAPAAPLAVPDADAWTHLRVGPFKTGRYGYYTRAEVDHLNKRPGTQEHGYLSINPAKLYMAAQPAAQPADARGVRGSTILLSSGRYFDFLNPSPLTIEEVAHALAHICRFTGHSRRFYSVAQHSVLVSRLVPSDWALHGLLHDAVEAVVGDMASPLKRLIPEYKQIEKRCEAVILAGFGLDFIPPVVKEMDVVALRTEQRDMMDADTDTWTFTHGVRPHQDTIMALPSSEAKAAFLDRYAAVVGARTQGGAAS